jgi:hypothetical protein
LSSGLSLARFPQRGMMRGKACIRPRRSALNRPPRSRSHPSRQED